MRVTYLLILALVACAHPPKSGTGVSGLPQAQFATLEREYVAPGSRYRLRMPASWSTTRYAIHERSPGQLLNLHPQALDWVSCDYEPADRHLTREPLVGIVTFRATDWIDLGAVEQARFEQVVAQTSDHVFVALLSGPVPYPSQSEDAREFARMRLTLEQVQTAFLFPDGRNALMHQRLAATGEYDTYVRDVPSGRWLQVSLSLRADGSALIRKEISPGRQTRELGRWHQTQDLVMLQTLDRKGKPAGMPLLWTYQNQHLVPRSWDRETFGISGLYLNKLHANRPVGLAGNPVPIKTGSWQSGTVNSPH